MNEFFGENNPTRRRVVTAHGIMKRPRREFKVPKRHLEDRHASSPVSWARDELAVIVLCPAGYLRYTAKVCERDAAHMKVTVHLKQRSWDGSGSAHSKIRETKRLTAELFLAFPVTFIRWPGGYSGLDAPPPPKSLRRQLLPLFSLPDPPIRPSSPSETPHQPGFPAKSYQGHPPP